MPVGIHTRNKRGNILRSIHHEKYTRYCLCHVVHAPENLQFYSSARVHVPRCGNILSSKNNVTTTTVMRIPQRRFFRVFCLFVWNVFRLSMVDKLHNLTVSFFLEGTFCTCHLFLRRIYLDAYPNLPTWQTSGFFVFPNVTEISTKSRIWDDI